MNFSQRISGIITLIVIGMTMAIVGVCFRWPYSGVFMVEVVAIIGGELLVGGTFIGLLKKSDTVFPHAVNGGYISIAYLCFTLSMIYPACYGIGVAYFILCHGIGLALAGIAYGILIFGEHGIKIYSEKSEILYKNKKMLFLQMKEISSAISAAFPTDPLLLSESEKMVDDFRFAATFHNGMESTEQDIQKTLIALQGAIKKCDADGYRRSLTELKRLYRYREALAKLN